MQDCDAVRTGVSVQHGTSSRQAWGMSVGQLAALLDALPLDLTYVENDGTIRYYNGNTHKVYPRDAGLIGRRVQDCHGMTCDARRQVDQILHLFASGGSTERVTVSREAGRTIHVRYVAVRGADGSCIGTLEVTQDVTHIVGHAAACPTGCGLARQPHENRGEVSAQMPREGA